MTVIKPIKPVTVKGYEEFSIINEDDDCFKHTHGLSNDPEFTICSLAFEDETEYKTVDEKINCPACIKIIEYYKQFKKGRDY